MEYDVVVVGARCAGAPTAMLLARKGHKVLLVDRALFPSDTISGHFIKQVGTKRLQRWDVLPSLMATGCPLIKKHQVTFGDLSSSAGEAAPDAVGSLAPRRFILDKILVEAATASGVEFRDGVTVQEVLWDDGRAIGVKGVEHRRVAHFTERARLVVGADGKYSHVARLVDALTYRATPSVSIGYYAYWTGFVTSSVEIFFGERLAVGAFPTHNQQVLIWTQWPWQERHTFKAAMEVNYLKSLASFPSIAERLEHAHRVSPILGMVELPNFFRVPFGPGWALVGDAGHHKDPLVARGISDAFRDAELLADAAHRALAGQAEMSTALHEYHRARDAAATLISDLNVELAQLNQPLATKIVLSQKLAEAEQTADQAFP